MAGSSIAGVGGRDSAYHSFRRKIGTFEKVKVPSTSDGRTGQFSLENLRDVVNR